MKDDAPAEARLAAAIRTALGSVPAVPPDAGDGFCDRLAASVRAASASRKRRRAVLRRAAAVFAAALLLAGCAVATGYFTGLLRRAEAGDAEAQLKVGAHFLFGKEVERDDEQGADWIRKAAEQGNAQAQTVLGGLFALGNGVETNAAAAVEWYRKAAEQGDGFGQYNLGLAYKWGNGVETNDTEAVKWFRKSADRGVDAAMLYLGYAYYRGEGVERDFSAAAEWFRKAIDRFGEMPDGERDELSFSKALGKLSAMYWYGLGVKRDKTLSSNLLVRAKNANANAADDNFDYVKSAARPNASVQFWWHPLQSSDTNSVSETEWLRREAERGDPIHQYCFGFTIWNRDRAAALGWFRKSAEAGCTEAQVELAKALRGKDPSMAIDPVEAADWFRKAAENGDAEAQWAFGCCVYSGDGVEKDEREGAEWIRKAAERGFVRAQRDLGKLYWNGTGVESNRTEAVSWTRKAAEGGDAGAQWNLASCLGEESANADRRREAVFWILKAAEAGQKQAVEWVKRWEQTDPEGLEWARRVLLSAPATNSVPGSFAQPAFRED